MKTKQLVFGFLLLCIFGFYNCSVKNAIDDSIDAVECANLITRISEQDDDRPCSEIIADIDRIFRTCDDFISDEDKESLELARSSCEGN